MTAILNRLDQSDQARYSHLKDTTASQPWFPLDG
jgi:hypothetical protein